MDPWPGAVPLAEGGSADTASYSAVATLEHAENPVHWTRVGLDYTFIRLSFRKSV